MKDTTFWPLMLLILLLECGIVSEQAQTTAVAMQAQGRGAALLGPVQQGGAASLLAWSCTNDAGMSLHIAGDQTNAYQVLAPCDGMTHMTPLQRPSGAVALAATTRGTWHLSLLTQEILASISP